MPGKDWVRLTTAESEAMAALWCEMLRSEGIPCFYRPGGAGVGYFSPAFLPHHILVLRPDLERAKLLLSSLSAHPGETEV